MISPPKATAFGGADLHCGACSDLVMRQAAASTRFFEATEKLMRATIGHQPEAFAAAMAECADCRDECIRASMAIREHRDTAAHLATAVENSAPAPSRTSLSRGIEYGYGYSEQLGETVKA